MRITQQEEQDAKCLGLNGERFAAVSYNAELPLSDLNISKAENKTFTFHHEHITPLSGNDQVSIMTMQNHEQRVHSANQAEVIFDDNFEVARICRSRTGYVPGPLCGCALPGKPGQYTPPNHRALGHGDSGHSEQFRAV